jgi:hypothetical protein
MPRRDRALAKLALGPTSWIEAAQVVVDGEELVDAGAAAITGEVARAAADRAIERSGARAPKSERSVASGS